MTYTGHIETGKGVLDEPTPLTKRTRARIEVVSSPGVPASLEAMPSLAERLAGVIGKARHLPADWSENHDRYLAFHLLVLWASLILCASIHADSIVLDGQRHEEVLVTVGATMYYVSFPKTGMTVTVNKSNVPASDVQIDGPGEERDALFNEWRSANERLKAQRKVDEKLREMKAQSDMKEKERQDALVEEQKRERERLLELEETAKENERLGKSAEEVLDSEKRKFQDNILIADTDEARDLETELEKLDREVRVALIKSIADPLYDANAKIRGELNARSVEITNAIRARAKRSDRTPDEPGYSLSVRKEVAAKTLIEQGWSRSEANATVEDMLERDMLPDPPRISKAASEPKMVRFPISVRRAAATKTLVELGWAQAQAQNGVNNLESRGALPDPHVAYTYRKPQEPSPKSPVLVSAIQYATIVAAYVKTDRLVEPNSRDRTFFNSNLTTYQQEAKDEERTRIWAVKRAEIDQALGGLRVRWVGWIHDVETLDDDQCHVRIELDYPPDNWSDVSIYIESEYARKLVKNSKLEFEGTITDWNLRRNHFYLSNVTYTTQ